MLKQNQKNKNQAQNQNHSDHIGQSIEKKKDHIDLIDHTDVIKLK